MDHMYVCRYGDRSRNWLEMNVLCLEISVLGGWRGHLTDWNFTVMLEESDHHMEQSAPFQHWFHSKAQKGHKGWYININFNPWVFWVKKMLKWFYDLIISCLSLLRQKLMCWSLDEHVQLKQPKPCLDALPGAGWPHPAALLLPHSQQD